MKHARKNVIHLLFLLKLKLVQKIITLSIIQCEFSIYSCFVNFLICIKIVTEFQIIFLPSAAHPIGRQSQMSIVYQGKWCHGQKQFLYFMVVGRQMWVTHQVAPRQFALQHFAPLVTSCPMPHNILPCNRLLS